MNQPREENGAFGLPQLIDAAKLFIITVLIAASLQEIGKGLFGYLHVHRSPGGASNLVLFSQQLRSFRLWQILIVLYFTLTVIRHAGAIFAATPIFHGRQPDQADRRGHAFRFFIGLTDMILTLGLFVLHYIVALSLGHHWNEGQTAGNIEPLLLIALTLFMDAVLCVSWVLVLYFVKHTTLLMREDEQTELRSLNLGWGLFSLSECLLFVLLVLLMEASMFAPVALGLGIAILAAILDFVVNGQRWRAVIQGRFR